VRRNGNKILRPRLAD